MLATRCSTVAASAPGETRTATYTELTLWFVGLMSPSIPAPVNAAPFARAGVGRVWGSRHVRRSGSCGWRRGRPRGPCRRCAYPTGRESRCRARSRLVRSVLGPRDFGAERAAEWCETPDGHRTPVELQACGLHFSDRRDAGDTGYRRLGRDQDGIVNGRREGPRPTVRRGGGDNVIEARREHQDRDNPEDAEGPAENG